LLRYNGARWELYPLPNESIVRSVRVLDDKIYTGGYREFGFWQPNALGELEYTSLSREIQDALLPDEEFWNILRSGRFIVFHSLDRIYTYNPENTTLKWVDTQSSLPSVFAIGQSVFFQKPGEGLFSIENGKASLKYDAEAFRNDEVVNMFEKAGRRLVLTRKNGFFAIEGNEVIPWETALNKVLYGINIYSALIMRDGGFALGTISDGLILLDKDGEIQCRIDLEKGLRNNTVLSLHETTESTLWLGLDNGLSLVNLSSPFRVYQDNSGYIGSVYATAENQGYLYMGTNQGLYAREMDSDPGFKMIPGTEGQVWSLQIIDNTLFCAHHSGTFIIEGERARQVASVPGTWGFTAIPGEDALVLQGNYSGLHVLEKRDGDWTLRNKVSGFDNSSRFLEIFKGEIFVNHEYKGIFRLKPDPGYNQVRMVEVDTVHRGANSGLLSYGGQLLFAYREGIFAFNTASGTFVKDSTLSRVIEEGGYVSGKLISGGEGKPLWIFTGEEISYVTPGKLDARPLIRSIPVGADARKSISGYESVYGPDREGHFLFGANNGFFSFDLNAVTETKLEVRLDKISMSSLGSWTWENNLVDPAVEGDFGNAENSLTFSYYTPVFRALTQPRFQYRLIGMQEDWSPWTENTTASFSNLPHGSYRFDVRARMGNELSSNTVSYAFDIARPWYLSGLAMGSYLLLLFLGALFIHRGYRYSYRRRQQEIIESNKQDMALARAQSEKEIIRLKNKQLKKEFRNKKNELAASTLSIIRKNELLGKVKVQLTSSAQKDSADVRNIVKIIDQNLNQTDDWEMFLEAFNHADHKFLKKLKKDHPNLSPNDIKLCAYLRLNLSSKEIAPLLNISTRSVEIKRYRLRKKLNLEHDDNLTDYILTL
jgi:DNA-binding CsgD family transcriptional regulator